MEPFCSTDLRPTVLLVDSDQVARRRIRTLVEESFSVVEGQDLLQALDLYTEVHPQAVVLSWTHTEALALSFLLQVAENEGESPVTIVLADAPQISLLQKTTETSDAPARRAGANSRSGIVPPSFPELGVSAVLPVSTVSQNLVQQLNNLIWARRIVVENKQELVTSRLRGILASRI